MTAEAATSEALWEMEGQMLASRSSLWQEIQEEEQYGATYPCLSATAATSQESSSLEFIAVLYSGYKWLKLACKE